MKIKFNTRKINRELGADADDFRYIIEREPKTISPMCNSRVVDFMVSNGLAKIDSRGPGWDLQVFSRTDELLDQDWIVSYSYSEIRGGKVCEVVVSK